jgi:hypothetical protein
MANDLHRLLKAARIDGPYLLVGHSLGGLIVRQFADEHSGDVAGIVLVDASSELGNLTAEHLASSAQKITQLEASLKAAAPNRLMSPVPPGAPAYVMMSVLPETTRTVIEEMKSFQLVPEARRREGGFGSLGGIPLVVIRHGRPSSDAAAEVQWKAAQESLARLSTHATSLVAEYSGHLVPADQPEIIAAAIHRLLLPTAAPLPVERPAVDVSADLLAHYVGVYRLGAQFDFRVSIENGALMLQPDGQTKDRLYAASSTIFFSRSVDAQLVFDVGADGQATGFSLTQNGLAMTVRKLSAE